jgi:aromatic ring-cleaving dioxygenase
VGYDQVGLTGYTEYNTEDWFNYQVGERLPVSLGVLAGEDIVADHQDQTYEQLRARARYSYTEKLVFDVSAGGELREYENGKGDHLYPVFTAAGEYRPTERSAVRLMGFRQQYAAIFNGYNYQNTGVSLEIRQEITDRFKVILSGSYNDIDFTPTGGALSQYTADYYLTRISFEAKIVRHLNGQVFYQLLKSQSHVIGNIPDDQTGVQITLSY